MKHNEEYKKAMDELEHEYREEDDYMDDYMDEDDDQLMYIPDEINTTGLLSKSGSVD